MKTIFCKNGSQIQQEGHKITISYTSVHDANTAFLSMLKNLEKVKAVTKMEV